MLLSTWITKKGGNAQAAAILGVRRNCAYSWVKGIALPRPEVMKRIVQKTNGKVTLSEMIDEYLDKHKKLAASKNGKTKTTKVLKTGTKTAQKKSPAKAKKGATPVKKQNGAGKKKKTVDPGF